MEPIDMTLKELWDAGKTGAEIAQALGMTRSAVMGRVHRLRAKGVDLTARPAVRRPSKDAQKRQALNNQEVIAMPFVMPKYAVKKDAKPKQQEPVQPEPVIEKTLEPEPVKAKPVPITELEFYHCRYIVKVSKTRGALYCAEPKKVRSYCLEHAKLCFQPVQKTSGKSRPSHGVKLHPFNQSRL